MGAARRALALATAWLLLLSAPLLAAPPIPAPARVLGAEWTPGDGERNEQTRVGPRFEELGYFVPIRLHLRLGGHLDAVFGGADPALSRLLVVDTRGIRLDVDFSLISAVTPLRPLETVPIGSRGRTREPLDAGEFVDKLVPTWRSHVGVITSVGLAGTGLLLQKEKRDRRFAPLLIAADLFFLAGGFLAIFAAPGLDQVDRTGISIAFFGMSGFVKGTSVVAAFRAGRESRKVPVRRAERRAGSP